MSSAPHNNEQLRVASVSCNHCGAPLQLPEETRFATCSNCGARLEVLHQGGAVFIIAAIVGGVNAATKASDYSVAEENYQRDRRQLLSNLQNQKTK